MSTFKSFGVLGCCIMLMLVSALDSLALQSAVQDVVRVWTDDLGDQHEARWVYFNQDGGLDYIILKDSLGNAVSVDINSLSTSDESYVRDRIQGIKNNHTLTAKINDAGLQGGGNSVAIENKTIPVDESSMFRRESEEKDAQKELKNLAGSKALDKASEMANMKKSEPSIIREIAGYVCGVIAALISFVLSWGIWPFTVAPIVQLTVSPLDNILTRIGFALVWSFLAFALTLNLIIGF